MTIYTVLLILAAFWLIVGWLMDEYENAQGMDAEPDHPHPSELRVSGAFDDLERDVDNLRESMGLPYIGPERRTWRAQR